MTNRTDIAGQRFGRLTAVRKVGAKWECRCDCGEIRLNHTGSLLANRVRSCGCGRADGIRAAIATHRETLGRKASKEYSTWAHVIQRCTNPRHKNWPRYGGRGIVVCDRWQSFENFLADMGRAPSSKHTIERKDNNGGYEPDNCVWATRKAQGQNTANAYRIEHGAEQITLKEYCARLGISYAMICQRMHRHKIGYLEAIRMRSQ